MSAWTKFRDQVRDSATGWWNGLSIINKTRIGTGAASFAVGFVLGAILL